MDGVANIVALISGVAAIVSAVAAVLLTIRQVRNKERRAAKAELDSVLEELADERRRRLAAERHAYDCELELARHGLEAPEVERGPD